MGGRLQAEACGAGFIEELAAGARMGGLGETMEAKITHEQVESGAVKAETGPVVTPTDPALEQELAWVGDAVLALWARERVLRERGRLDTPEFLKLTSNEFLQSLGRPTRVEAEFGVVYRRDGLAAAFAYIEARVVPMHRRQEANRRRQRRG